MFLVFCRLFFVLFFDLIAFVLKVEEGNVVLNRAPFEEDKVIESVEKGDNDGDIDLKKAKYPIGLRFVSKAKKERDARIKQMVSRVSTEDKWYISDEPKASTGDFQKRTGEEKDNVTLFTIATDADRTIATEGKKKYTVKLREGLNTWEEMFNAIKACWTVTDIDVDCDTSIEVDPATWEWDLEDNEYEVVGEPTVGEEENSEYKLRNNKKEDRTVTVFELSVKESFFL